MDTYSVFVEKCARLVPLPIVAPRRALNFAGYQNFVFDGIGVGRLGGSMMLLTMVVRKFTRGLVLQPWKPPGRTRLYQRTE
jgi:hypothetical protein